MTNQQRIVSAVAVFCIVVFGALFLFFRDSVNEIDKIPEETGTEDFSISASVVNGEELFSFLEGDRYDQITRDLFLFAKKHYKEYENLENKVVGFYIENIDENDTILEVRGYYGSQQDNQIYVMIESLKNSRQKVTIKDKTLGITEQEDLFSNNARNSFIASLPINKDGVSISYLPKTDGYYVVLEDEKIETINNALILLLSGSDNGTLIGEEITTIVNSPDGSIKTLENPFINI